MSEIQRVTDPRQGPMDGVSLEAGCVLTTFQLTEDPQTRKIENQTPLPCNILASYSDGTMSFSVRELGLMLTVRLDEIFAVAKTAADAAEEAAAADDPVYPRPGGPRSLYCYRCHCWVPDTANTEMKKEGVYAHSHVCGNFSNGEIKEREEHTK